MSKRPRRERSSLQKAALLKKHHVDKVPVSDVCDEAELQPSEFYHWQRHLFEPFGGSAAQGQRAERPGPARPLDRAGGAREEALR